VRGLLLAGGNGTRLRPITFTRNKHMIPIANKPLILHGLEHLIDAGIKELAIILGPLKNEIVETLGDGSNFGVDITYIVQSEPKGLAHAAMIAQDFLGKEPFIMYLGDILLKQGLKPLIETYQNESSDCLICTTQVNNPNDYGIVEMDQQGNIERLVEKPKSSTSTLALAGIYLFNESIFDAIKNINPSWRNELEITDAIQYLLENGKKINIHKIEGWWKDTGRPKDLLEANRLILDQIEPSGDGDIKSTSALIEKVNVGTNSTIGPEVVIKGPCVIGDNCNISGAAYIGPYVSIGNNTQVLCGDIEGSIVMSNCVINCRRRIVESIIGSGSKIESLQGDTEFSKLQLLIGDNTSMAV
jgi:glucose-1-phosphate thymidylyltransferase